MFFTFKPWFFSFDDGTLLTSMEREVIDSYWTKDVFERRLKEVNDGEGANISIGECQVKYFLSFIKHNLRM